MCRRAEISHDNRLDPESQRPTAPRHSPNFWKRVVRGDVIGSVVTAEAGQLLATQVEQASHRETGGKQDDKIHQGRSLHRRVTWKSGGKRVQERLFRIMQIDWQRQCYTGILHLSGVGRHR